MDAPQFSVDELRQLFPNNEACLQHLFREHHAGTTCPKCGASGKYYLQRGTSKFICQCGGHQISPKKGTIFEKSDTDLSTWYYAIFLMSRSRSGCSAKELERSCRVTYKTAWRMTTRIRELMKTISEMDWTLASELQTDPEFSNTMQTLLKTRTQRQIASLIAGMAYADQFADLDAEELADTIRLSISTFEHFIVEEEHGLLYDLVMEELERCERRTVCSRAN